MDQPMRAVRLKDAQPPAAFKRLYRPLGHVAFAFSELDGQLTRTLNMLLGGARGMALEWLFQSFNGRLKLFHFLAFDLCDRRVPTPNVGLINWPTAKGSDELREGAQEIVTGLLQANDDRNNLLHGPWTEVSTPGPVFSRARYRVDDGRFGQIPLHGITVALLEEEAEFLMKSCRRRAAHTRFSSGHPLSARGPQDLDRCRRDTEAIVDIHRHGTWGTARQRGIQCRRTARGHAIAHGCRQRDHRRGNQACNDAEQRSFHDCHNDDDAGVAQPADLRVELGELPTWIVADDRIARYAPARAIRGWWCPRFT